MRSLSDVRLLALDFDGVLTDNSVYVFEDGREAVRCSRADGIGIQRLKALGVEVIVISSEANPVVAARCAKLGVLSWHGRKDKLAVLWAHCALNKVPLTHVAYLGNDVNDLDCLRAVGFPFVVDDVEPSSMLELNPQPLWLTRRGGRGAVRELCDMITAAKQHASARTPEVTADVWD